MTKDEALNLALEALEKSTRYFNIVRLGESRLKDTEIRCASHAAITAIKKALAQPEESHEPFEYWNAVEEMWAALAAYQPQADAAGHGESWARMCSEKTAAAANEAAYYAAYAAYAAAAYAAAAAAAAAADEADAASYAPRAEKCAQIAIDRIKRITKEIK